MNDDGIRVRAEGFLTAFFTIYYGKRPIVLTFGNTMLYYGSRWKKCICVIENRVNREIEIKIAT